MSRGYQRIQAPSKGVAKGEYHIPIFWQHASFTTTGTAYSMVSQAAKILWTPANWPSSMQWYLECLINCGGAGLIHVHLFNYSSGGLGATDFGGVAGGGFVYTPELQRSAALVMPAAETILTLGFKVTSDTGALNGARLIGIPL